MHSKRRVALVVGLTTMALASLAFAATAMAQEAEVTVGSQDAAFSQNKQNEPWVAIDPSNPSHLAAGANDNIDLELCNAGDDTTCPFTAGVGISGVQFSSNGGHSWVQPNYTGYSARIGVGGSCIGVIGPDPGCTPQAGGPIGTLPKYYENGLVSNGDPALVFGPRPGPNGFSWANGSRLYYANIATPFPGRQPFKGFAAIAVSRTDNFEAAMAGSNAAWMKPVIATKQNSALFSDKEAITADDAESSPYFGNVYVCNVAFRSIASAPEPVMVARSTDGGATWTTRQVTAATNNNQTGGRQGCSIKTDSRGVVFLFFLGTDIQTRGSVVYLARSYDGGQRFERPRIVARVDECGLFDPATGRFSFDGVAGARTDSFPIADVANGAPTGFTAAQRAADPRRDEIVFTFCDGPTPSVSNPGANEQARIRYSTNGGRTFQEGPSMSPASDRPDFPAVAISPNGTKLYGTYTNFLQPWQTETLAPPRLAQGTTRTSTVAPGGVPGAWSELDRAPTGDARASSQNNLVAEFLGDYNFADATNVFGVTVWNDVREAADCPAIDEFRDEFLADVAAGREQPEEEDVPEARYEQEEPSVHEEGGRPAPNWECPVTWGNSDIWSYTTAP